MSNLSSVNTNVGSLVALTSLNSTQRALQSVQKRITTGNIVNDAIDDGASYAVAQRIRGDLAGLTAVNQQLGQGQAVVSVALQGATNISNTLQAARATITRLADGNLASTQRVQYSADLSRLVGEVQNFRDNATFNGVNLLSAGSGNRNVIANANGNSITITSQQITNAPINNIFISTAANNTSGDYQKVLTQSLVTLENTVLNALNSLGGDYRRLNNQLNFNANLITANTQAVGIVVDADLSQESARFQSLQVRQSLGIQTLGIANGNPQSLLGLFR